MSRVAVLTDSTAYLPPEVIKQYGLHVVPLKVHWGEETFLDGVDITPAQFYARLAKDPLIPTTSQPSVHDFTQAFDQLAPSADGILAVLLSSGISGTMASAITAVEQYDRLPVEIVDTLSTGSGLALVVLAAARAASQGRTLEEVAKVARDAARTLHIFFVVDTLKYLHRGGRIGGASRYLGTALAIKPILHFNTEGKIEALDRVRTRRKALIRLVDLAEEQAGGKPVHVGLMHANAPEVVAELHDMVSARLECTEISTYALSPVIGTHAGPGTVGLALYTE